MRQKKGFILKKQTVILIDLKKITGFVFLNNLCYTGAKSKQVSSMILEGWLSGLKYRIANAACEFRTEGSNPSPSEKKIF